MFFRKLGWGKFPLHKVRSRNYAATSKFINLCLTILPAVPPISQLIFLRENVKKGKQNFFQIKLCRKKVKMLTVIQIQVRF